MAAELQIYKYSGKDGTFGTPVTGIGIKRIDAVVPAVYQSTSSGGTVTPSDDKSDANTYCIYRPDDPDATAYLDTLSGTIEHQTAMMNLIRRYPEYFKTCSGGV